MNELDDYHKVVDDKFKEYMELVKTGTIRSIAIVIVNQDLTSRVDTFGTPDIALVGSLDYCKHRILMLNCQGEEVKLLNNRSNAND